MAMAVAVRKVVTVLFCDVVEFTTMGDEFDPERLRQVMSRFFGEMEAVLERHGGTVEKFIGDEVMAVFGVPVAHEDDALRAVRAAAAMVERLDTLNDELERSSGVRLQVRIGVNTGEVVAGDPSRGHGFVTGDAVNVAKRLQSAADPGQILIGKATYPLVSHAIRAGPLQTFSVKGKAAPVSSLRLDAVDAEAGAIARRLDAPLVGRAPQLAQLLETFERVERGRACELVTILGAAGIGKSRLTAELLASVDARAQAFAGRCLPYGDGITFWPIAEIVRRLGGASGLKTALAGADDGDAVANAVLGAIGAATPVAADETFSAVRRLLETLARTRPIVVVFEDIHWAEPTFLDLVEYVVGWARDAPMLVVCLARRDLLDLRPAWATPRPNAQVVSLDPLADDDVAQLLADLGVALPQETLRRVAASAEGNPLFVEQLVAHAAESGGELGMPPSIHALLAERLDRLDVAERTLIERAAVVGREFPRGAVADLSPPELRRDVGGHLLQLVRKDLIRPDASPFAHEDGFRFRHALIRDAAYQGISKETRADLHARFADWIQEGYPDRATELEEIVGFHLEHAWRYREQLGLADDTTRALARRAADVLASAGARAIARGDMPAAVALLTRATILLRDDDAARLRVAPDLAAALVATGELVQAEALLERTVEGAELEGDRLLRAHAAMRRAEVRVETGTESPIDAADEARAALETFAELGDELGVARAWHLLSYVEGTRFAEQEEMLERALEHVRRTPDQRERASILIALATSAYYGPRPAEDAIRRCDEIMAEAAADRTLRAATAALAAGLHAMCGRFDVARGLAADSRRIFEELGTPGWLAGSRGYSGIVELLSGDAEAAERELRWACDTLRAAGARFTLATWAALLAEAVLVGGRADEALLHAREAEAAAAADDVFAQVAWRRTAAKATAATSGPADAIAIGRDAVALAAATDCLNIHADALVALADVQARAGDAPGRRGALERALELYDAKGNVVSAAGVRRSLARRPVGPGA
jgi:class 3 adenylate cyclase